jgi:hypothetical protein
VAYTTHSTLNARDVASMIEMKNIYILVLWKETGIKYYLEKMYIYLGE